MIKNKLIVLTFACFNVFSMQNSSKLRQNKLTRLLNSLKEISFPNEEESLEVICLQDYITSLPIDLNWDFLTESLNKYNNELKIQSSKNKLKFFFIDNYQDIPEYLFLLSTMELNYEERKNFTNYLLKKDTLYKKEMKFFVQSFYQYPMHEKKRLLTRILTKFNHTRLSETLVQFFYQAREKEKLAILKLIVDQNLIGSHIDYYLMFFEEESHEHAVEIINKNPSYNKFYLMRLEKKFIAPCNVSSMQNSSNEANKKSAENSNADKKALKAEQKKTEKERKKEIEEKRKKIEREIEREINKEIKEKRKKIEREIKIEMEQKTLEARAIERNQQKKELEYGEYADREREKEIEIQQIAIEEKEKETMKKRFFYN